MIGCCYELGMWYILIDNRYMDRTGRLHNYAADGVDGCLFNTQAEAKGAFDEFAER